MVVELGANDTGLTGTYGNALVVSSISHLTCTYVSGSLPVAGDVIMFGTWRGDYNDIAQRIVLDVIGTTIRWGEPLIPTQINNIDTLAELPTPAYVKNFSALNAQMSTAVSRLREVNPDMKILFVSYRLPSWTNSNAGIWGMDLYYKQVAKEFNVTVLSCEDYIRDYLYANISGDTYIDITATGALSYDVSSFITGLNRQAFKVLVNGEDVYNKDCYVDINAKTLVFRQNEPASGTIKLIGSDLDWSTDGIHESPEGARIYVQALIQALSTLK